MHRDFHSSSTAQPTPALPLPTPAEALCRARQAVQRQLHAPRLLLQQHSKPCHPCAGGDGGPRVGAKNVEAGAHACVRGGARGSGCMRVGMCQSARACVRTCVLAMETGGVCAGQAHQDVRLQRTRSAKCSARLSIGLQHLPLAQHHLPPPCPRLGGKERADGPRHGLTTTSTQQPPRCSPPKLMAMKEARKRADRPTPAATFGSSTSGFWSSLCLWGGGGGARRDKGRDGAVPTPPATPCRGGSRNDAGLQQPTLA